MDWGHFKVDDDGKLKRLYAFVMVLGYSRAMDVEFTEDGRLDTLMGCHTRAFEYFGGMTRNCLYDNMKTVVNGQDENGETLWNEQFQRFAHHYGFVLRRCKPYRPQTKGKVESGVGYVRKNFWPRVRTFIGLQDLNRQVRHWLDTVANQRLHGTTFRVPAEMRKEETLNPVTAIAAHDLVQTLQSAHLTNTIKQKIRMFIKLDLLIIDEIGYRKMDDTAAHFFFQIVSERYERGSMMLTSSQTFGVWGDIFGDTVLATAILDRLLHHSSTVNIKGETYRIKDKKKAGFFRPDSIGNAEADR